MYSSINLQPRKKKTLFSALFSFLLLCLFSGIAHSSDEKLKKNQFSGPLQVTFLTDGKLVRLDKKLSFFDSNGKKWTAREGMTSDGATIPGGVWPLIGPPLRGPYVRAAIVHDQYCYSRTEPAEEVHKMFRDAMVVDNVPPWKVNFMYGAVLWKGPKWGPATVANARRLFKQRFYDGEKGLRECIKSGDQNCHNKYMSPNAFPPNINYATSESSYKICKESQCTWTDLKEFEDQWMNENSVIPATDLTEDEINSLLEQAKRNPDGYKEMEEFIEGKIRN